MERFVTASIDDLEVLFAAAKDGAADVERAMYPPGCDPSVGPLRFRPLEVGGLMVEVERRDLDVDDFRLGVLFYSGASVFTDATDLARFFRGSVATAFGLTAAPPPEHPTAGFLDDLQPRALPATPTNRRRRARTSGSGETPPSSADLARRLQMGIRGQKAAVARIAEIVSSQLAKSAPARPESMLLIGPTGTGKTSAIEALPASLDDLGYGGAHVFRVDCNELTDDYDMRRFLGCAPGLIGYTTEPPFVAALRKPGCIVLLDEFEKAHEAVQKVFLGLLDEGRITAPDGTNVQAPGAVVAMTTNLGADDLSYRLREAPDHNRWRQSICRDHLLREGWQAELVGRIGAFAVFEPLTHDSLRDIAQDAIRSLGREYGLELEALPPVLVDVVLDLADSSEVGARALTYAARDLLADAFAEAERNGFSGPATLDAGPPPRVLVGSECRL